MSPYRLCQEEGDAWAIQTVHQIPSGIMDDVRRGPRVSRQSRSKFCELRGKSAGESGGVGAMVSEEAAGGGLDRAVPYVR